jgi:hypothetical protein
MRDAKGEITVSKIMVYYTHICRRQAAFVVASTEFFRKMKYNEVRKEDKYQEPASLQVVANPSNNRPTFKCEFTETPSTTLKAITSIIQPYSNGYVCRQHVRKPW